MSRMGALAVVAVSLAALAGTGGCLDSPDSQPAPGIDAAVDSECDRVFGSARGYVLCDSDDASCTFYLNLDGEFSCATACDGFGFACLDGWDDTASENQCEVEVHVGCGDVHSDEICQCGRPPA